MGQQQLPQQPVLPLLQPSVGHWGWLCNKSGAVLQFHGSCPWHVRYGELLSWGVCEETAEVLGSYFLLYPQFLCRAGRELYTSLCSEFHLFQGGYVDPSSFIGNIHGLLWVAFGFTPKWAQKTAPASQANLQHMAWLDGNLIRKILFSVSWSSLGHSKYAAVFYGQVLISDLW